MIKLDYFKIYKEDFEKNPLGWSLMIEDFVKRSDNFAPFQFEHKKPMLTGDNEKDFKSWRLYADLLRADLSMFVGRDFLKWFADHMTELDARIYYMTRKLNP